MELGCAVPYLPRNTYICALAVHVEPTVFPPNGGMMEKVVPTISQLIGLLRQSQQAGTQDKAIDLAVEWLGLAEEGFMRVRQESLRLPEVTALIEAVVAFDTDHRLSRTDSGPVPCSCRLCEMTEAALAPFKKRLGNG